MGNRLYWAAAAGLLAFGIPSAVSAQEASPQAQTVDRTSLSIAREIIDLGMPEEVRADIFLATMDQMMLQMREATAQTTPIEDPQVEAILDKHLGAFRNDAEIILLRHLPDLMEAWAVSYSNIFTREELIDIRDFIATPSGQRFFELSPAVVAEPAFASANQAYMNEAITLIEPMRQALMIDIFEYISEKEDGSTQNES